MDKLIGALIGALLIAAGEVILNENDDNRKGD